MNELEAFEGAFGAPEPWIEFCSIKDKYICKYNAIDHHLLMRNARWQAWQTSAQRRGYKLISIEEYDSLLKTIRDSQRVSRYDLRV